eukprot:2912903-Alexandrium_andersonii.AAC.2
MHCVAHLADHAPPRPQDNGWHSDDDAVIMMVVMVLMLVTLTKMKMRWVLRRRGRVAKYLPAALAVEAAATAQTVES